MLSSMTDSYNRYGLALADTIISDIILEDGRYLREALSRKNISYLEHLRSIDDDLHVYRAAPSFECLKDPERSEQIFLSGMQLAFILPWEHTLDSTYVQTLPQSCKIAEVVSHYFSHKERKT